MAPQKKVTNEEKQRLEEDRLAGSRGASGDLT